MFVVLKYILFVLVVSFNFVFVVLKYILFVLVVLLHEYHELYDNFLARITRILRFSFRHNKHEFYDIAYIYKSFNFVFVVLKYIIFLPIVSLSFVSFVL